jgi:hypothetical protein
VLPGDPLLQRFDLRLLELGDLAAFPADEVIVVSGQVALVPFRSLPEIQLFRIPVTDQQLEGPVYGGGTDGTAVSADAPGQLVDGQVGSGPEKFLHDPGAAPAALAAGFRDLSVDASEEGLQEVGNNLILILNFIFIIRMNLSCVNRNFLPMK